METQEAEHSLEIVVRGHHVYKYIWTPCLGERLSLCADVGNAHESYHTMLCFGDKRCGMVGHIPRNQLLCHDCRFRVIPWKLQIPRYRYTVTRGSAVKHIRLIKGVSYAIKLCAYQMNMPFLFSVCHLVGLVIADTRIYLR